MSLAGTFCSISLLLELYVNNNLLVLLFIVGGIYLIKEYLVAVRIAEMKEIIFSVNTFLLKYSFVFVIFDDILQYDHTGTGQLTSKIFSI